MCLSSTNASSSIYSLPAKASHPLFIIRENMMKNDNWRIMHLKKEEKSADSLFKKNLYQNCIYRCWARKLFIEQKKMKWNFYVRVNYFYKSKFKISLRRRENEICSLVYMVISCSPPDLRILEQFFKLHTALAFSQFRKQRAVLPTWNVSAGVSI